MKLIFLANITSVSRSSRNVPYVSFSEKFQGLKVFGRKSESLIIFVDTEPHFFIVHKHIGNKNRTLFSCENTTQLIRSVLVNFHNVPLSVDGYPRLN